MARVVLILDLLVALTTIYFVINLGRDVWQHREMAKKEPADGRILPFTASLIFFLSTLGASDFALSSAIYTRLGWTTVRKLPGTVNAQCILPLAVMTVAYLSRVQVSWWLLVMCIIAQVIGAYIGPRLVMRLPDRMIRLSVGVGLLVSAALLLANQLHWVQTTGNATSLPVGKAILLAALLFVYGALNNIGIGSFAPTMVTVSFFGMSPLVAFPIMMGAAFFSIVVGSTVFIQAGAYSRKIVSYTSIFGIIGVLVAVFIVGQLQMTVINWIILAILIYAAFILLRPTADEIEA
ncbi:hypothetical protein IV56_GL000453 [Lacticaseibacillus saniviri JCM 17471 = DSM 24301]|uniref:Probable membrane transporter protein n=1 Tax=Lacticaseibacillus saniviri JCM 17471 = DSM 24301 TaxID=1293598 RepID=A0A0R2MUN8_9LACO|nr:hypothetical protein IV56_GL000453 [Lacticaseibacillus saniviri JCM 17471 = DSM 24301]